MEHINERAARRLMVTQRHLAGANWGPRTGLQSNEVCGIVGFIGKEEAVPYLLEGLSILENRGYDSAGITTLDTNNELVTTKYASLNTTSDAIKRLRESAVQHKGHFVGIAHTRWATHGAKTDKNAHPHLDDKNRVAVVHNGVIENNSALPRR